ncbi:MAG: hypothetical protein ACKO1L_06595 [Brachymonas sp.]
MKNTALVSARLLALAALSGTLLLSACGGGGGGCGSGSAAPVSL